MRATRFAGSGTVCCEMKHIVLGSLAALVAAAITVSLHFYGAHDLQGFFAAAAGYPGLVANGHYDQLNEVLFTAVNWVFYFLLFEGIAVLKRKFSN
jgi:hypothetical protein